MSKLYLSVWYNKLCRALYCSAMKSCQYIGSIVWCTNTLLISLMIHSFCGVDPYPCWVRLAPRFDHTNSIQTTKTTVIHCYHYPLYWPESRSSLPVIPRLYRASLNPIQTHSNLCQLSIRSILYSKVEGLSSAMLLTLASGITES